MIINIENGKNVKTIKLDKDVISKPYIFNKNLRFIEQNHKLATYARKIKKKERCYY